MSVDSVIFVPELQYYFGEFVKSSRLNKYQVNIPATFSLDLISPASFIQLLFDDNWPNTYTSYKYKYRRITEKYEWPGAIRDRLCIYSQSAQYYTLDQDSTSSTNLFNLQSDDFLLLNKLLTYRVEGTVSIGDIDSTSLTTTLSRLIYRYLDLKVNSGYSGYNDIILISNSLSLLENCYETYVVENMFLYMSDQKL